MAIRCRADKLAARGDYRSALSTINVAPSCAPDVSLYMLATRYACAGHDIPRARDAFGHIPDRRHLASPRITTTSIGIWRKLLQDVIATRFTSAIELIGDQPLVMVM